MRPYVLESLKNNLTTTHAKSYMLASVCVWHVCSRWYTPELHVVTIGIYAYASSPPWYHGLYPAVKVFGVKYLEAASDRLLCVVICYKSFASQVLLKGPKQTEIFAPQTVNWTWEWLQRWWREVVDRSIVFYMRFYGLIYVF